MLGWLWPESPVDRWYRQVAEDLVPTGRFGFSYCGYELCQVLGIPEDHEWTPYARGVYMFVQYDSKNGRSVTLSPKSYSGDASPEWAFRRHFWFRSSAVRAVARSLKALDSAFPKNRARLIARQVEVVDAQP